MNCYVHPEKEAVGICTICGKPICSECAVEMQGKLVCRTCLASGRVNPTPSTSKDANTAFLIELVGGFFGLLGLGYLYVGRTNDGILRLIMWLLYNVGAYIAITLLISIFIGVVCCPFQLAIQIGVPIWSATTLKNQLMGGTTAAITAPPTN
jgi:TM2 domain-containing membrane protein YozV